VISAGIGEVSLKEYLQVAKLKTSIIKLSNAEIFIVDLPLCIIILFHCSIILSFYHRRRKIILLSNCSIAGPDYQAK
jgi:hypothetical protein